jgi:hypothetical protein
MSRPHIEFVQSQRLPWYTEPGGLGLAHKELSHDGVSGAATWLQRVPAGFQFGDGTPLAANEEFYVLDGAYYLNGYEYAGGCYGFYPAGHERRDIYSPNGAVLLRFFDAEPKTYVSDPEAPARAEGRPALPFVDTYRMTWDKRAYDIRLAHLNPARKILRIDPRDQQKTFLFATAPQTHPTNFRGPLESHPTPEEAFLIAGDLIGPLGVMQAGAYFWRPPGIPHGPFGSRGGSLSLIRFVGGAHENRWSEHQAAFSFAPPHQPILPADLAPYGAALEATPGY